MLETDLRIFVDRKVPMCKHTTGGKLGKEGSVDSTEQRRFVRVEVCDVGECWGVLLVSHKRRG